MNNNKNKSYKIITYGCQMNENDSEKLSGMLNILGYYPIERTKKGLILLYLIPVA